MREYWVNVYEGGLVGQIKFETRTRANVVGNWYKNDLRFSKVVYRIHVKLKDNYKCQ